MRLDKVVLRTLLTTLLAIIILVSALILLLCLAFPSTMMDITYKMGMNDASVKYAMRAYKQSGSVQYVAFATETAIGADDYADIERCGLQLIADEDFTLYCESRNVGLDLDTTKITYQQYVYGQVSVAQYRLDKKTEAQETAFKGVGSTFPQNNAVVGLMITAMTEMDGATVTEIKLKMQALLPNVTDTAQAQYLQEAIALCVNAGY